MQCEDVRDRRCALRKTVKISLNTNAQSKLRNRTGEVEEAIGIAELFRLVNENWKLEGGSLKEKMKLNTVCQVIVLVDDNE